MFLIGNFLVLLFIIILNFIFITSEMLMEHDKGSYENKKNVLIVIVDDLRHLMDEKINLPNLNKLAGMSINFKNAFAQQALCAPSRNSMLTGRRPDALRLYDFYSYWRETVGNYTTLPQLLKENGYDTYSVGKVFHPGKSSNFTDDYPYSWSRYPYHPPTEKYKDAAVCKDKITKKLQKNLICPVNVEKQPEKSLPDLESLNYAVKILKKYHNKKTPFLLTIGFHKPHIPLKFPREYLDRIPIHKVQPPKNPYIPQGMPMVSWHPWTDVRHRDDIMRLNISFPLGIMPFNWTIKIRQSYYAAAFYIDDLIGILLNYVDMNNTIVILTSDHGWSLGENGMWAKYSNFDVALRVPLIFKIPGMQPKSFNIPVELIDIFPTLVDIVGLSNNIIKCKNETDKSKLCFDGKSLVSLMRGDSSKSKYFAISQYPRPSVYPKRNSDKPRLKDINIMGYSVRTKRYRYTEWISFNHTSFTRNWNKTYGHELYDHVIDPYESKNVYFESKYEHMKKYLSELLHSRLS